MSVEWFDFGVLATSQSKDDLTVQDAIDIVTAVEESSFCEFIELRKIQDQGIESEIIVIDILCDGIPSKNPVGINYCERLALRFFKDTRRLPEVRALRRDFPTTYHQNHVTQDEPSSLCIYLEPWDSVKRSWTAQKHLKSISLWLEKTADKTLHADNQPLEPLFFENSRYQLVIPSDFNVKAGRDEWRLVISSSVEYKDAQSTIISSFVRVDDVEIENQTSLQTLAIQTPPIVHGEIERTPGSLGELQTSLLSRGADIEPLIYDAIRFLSENKGLIASSNEYALLVISIPLKRSADVDIERIQIRGFGMLTSLTDMGSQCGILRSNKEEGDKKFYFTPNLIEKGKFTSDKWKNIIIEPVEILSSFTKETARKSSGINSEDFIGILAGAGALGSAVHNIWTREGWGQWSLLDSDLIKPHNLARHTAYEHQIGVKKVEAVQSLANHIYSEDYSEINLYYGDANSVTLNDITENLVVDMTTSLCVPRDIAANDKMPRSVSAFITPSGASSILMIEDTWRHIRLDALEAQYYTEILRNKWGESHLSGHDGGIWVGAGCRDMSLVIPLDLINLHASILARHIRLKSESENAAISLWNTDPETGEVTVQSISPSIVKTINIENFTIVLNTELINKVRSLRESKLPTETGGIILGYFDLVSSRIYVVEFCPAPNNSVEELTGFERGEEGLEGIVNEANERTANIVSYIGEWHSHPKGSSTLPSTDDIKLLRHLAIELNNDGFPALMMIVGDKDENWLLGTIKE